MTSEMLKREKKKCTSEIMKYRASHKNDSFTILYVTFPRKNYTFSFFLFIENLLPYFLLERCHGRWYYRHNNCELGSEGQLPF